MIEQQAATLIPLSCRRVRDALADDEYHPGSPHEWHSSFISDARIDIGHKFPDVRGAERQVLAEEVVMAAYQTLAAWVDELKAVGT